MYQQQTRMTDILNYPLPDRIRQLAMCIESAPLKDLTDFFPKVVHSLFDNGAGWGLRTITEKNLEFGMLRDLFHPHGVFFQLLYRLLTVKFEIRLSELPVKLRQMLESGRHSAFYANILNIDNFQPRNFTLSLNAFDYYFFHFTIHGMKNLHKVSQAALAVNNENSTTVFFSLAADYLCAFLPSDPSSMVYPQLDCSLQKVAHTSMPMPPMNPTKPPKYLLLSALSHQIQNPTNSRSDLRLPDAVRSTNWRSESVMMIFIDCWLRYDVDESWELPSNEFIRLIRILVKQLHFFGNVHEQDHSSLSVLRQQAQSLLNIRIYPFLKTIVARWPLDTSFLNVLELWLSYVQPWRYVFGRNVQNLNNEVIEIPSNFRGFISENIVTYTQIFVRLVPRFLKMDLALNKNSFMLFRMMKVFRQLSDILRDLERQMMNNNSSTAMRSHGSFNGSHSFNHSSPPRASSSFNRSGERSPHPHYRSHNQSGIEDSSYIFMFGDEVVMQVYELMQRLYLSKLKTSHEVEKMNKELQKHTSLWERLLQLMGWLSSLNISFNVALEEKKKTTVYLDFCLNILSPVFNIAIEEATREFDQNASLPENSDDDDTINSDILNTTPSSMKQRLNNITYSGDPFLIPIMSYEFKFLVRLLHSFSCKLNDRFEDEFESLWHRNDFYGKISRQVLHGPVEARSFDKSGGYSELQIRQIGPRVSLRSLASQKIIMTIVFSFLLGRVLFGASSLGLLAFLIVSLGYVLIRAAMSN